MELLPLALIWVIFLTTNNLTALAPLTMAGTLSMGQNSFTMINSISSMTSLVTLSPSSLNSLVTSIGKLMSLSGIQTLTGDITLSPTTYIFSGALPTEIGYLSGVTSGIQTQLGTCMKLTGTNTLTGKITLAPTTYKFSGAFPTEIGYLSQCQLYRHN